MTQQANKIDKFYKNNKINARVRGNMFNHVSRATSEIEKQCVSAKLHSLRSRNRREFCRFQSCKSCQLCEQKPLCRKHLVPATLKDEVFSYSLIQFNVSNNAWYFVI